MNEELEIFLCFKNFFEKNLHKIKALLFSLAA